MPTDVRGVPVFGMGVRSDSRCDHYHSDLDVVAIRFKCCGRWYACRECHDAVAGHEAKVWGPGDANEIAFLCGRCGWRLSIADYVACASRCPACGCGFNPGCRSHDELYFSL